MPDPPPFAPVTCADTECRPDPKTLREFLAAFYEWYNAQKDTILAPSVQKRYDNRLHSYLSSFLEMEFHRSLASRTQKIEADPILCAQDVYPYAEGHKPRIAIESLSSHRAIMTVILPFGSVPYTPPYINHIILKNVKKTWRIAEIHCWLEEGQR